MPDIGRGGIHALIVGGEIPPLHPKGGMVGAIMGIGLAWGIIGMIGPLRGAIMLGGVDIKGGTESIELGGGGGNGLPTAIMLLGGKLLAARGERRIGDVRRRPSELSVL
jgi:hypothetical protein